MASKRLAILGTRGIPARYGGFETFADELSTRLVQKGVSVTVFCEEESGVDHPDEYRGVELRYVKTFKLGPLTTVFFDLVSLWQARKDFDVVYLLGYGAAQFAFIPRVWGTQVWLNVDGIEWARSKWGRIAKFYFRIMEFFSVITPSRIIADAHEIESHLVSRYRFMKPCSVIPYGAYIVENDRNVEELKSWGIEPNEYYLVVARLEPENHILEIIEGYLLSGTKFPLLIVGDHKSGTIYAEKLLSFKDKVLFLGGIYEKEKLNTLRYNSFAYFHGHSVGGTNPSLLEALGCGNLIVAHDNVFNREVAGEFGHYFKYDEDIPEILSLLESLSVRQQEFLVDGARKRIREKYSWKKITNEYLDLLFE